MTKPTIIDPFAEREAQKYERPIPSREVILDYLRECGRLMRYEELLTALGLEEDPEQKEALKRRLRAMERDGQLVFTRRGGYGLPEKMDLVPGRVMGHKEGYGFVVPDEGGGDFFLSAYQMRSVFDGDRVLVRAGEPDRRGKREAAIVEVLERNTHSVVGKFFQEGNMAHVVPNSKRITQDVLIAPGESGDAKPGQIVVAEITTQPTSRTQPVGKVIEVLGEHLAPGMEIDVAIRTYGIPHVWSDEVTREAASFGIEISKAEKAKRVDLTELPLVTIDGEDAKDFDDAVFCKKRKASGWTLTRGGWTLYVAIADVSHYVTIDSLLDKEAAQRGNSVYFPGFVVPMLPEILSNELCSLKPNVERLAVVCEMDISSAGKLTAHRFYKAVIRSQARLTYTAVAQALENPKAPQAISKSLLPHLKELHNLFKVLYKTRQDRGAIDFETVETRVIFGEGRKIKQIVPTQRNVAHRIIEECMLLANVATARFLSKQKLPSLYRIHEGPNPDKLKDLRSFLGGLGLRLPGGKVPKPEDYAELLRSVVNRPDARLIQTVLLRSLSQAVYSPENKGHFGLAYSAYTHFTSPIRRYPDLLIHRTIQYALEKGKPNAFPYSHGALTSVGERCSVTERRADEATRDAMDTLKCEFIHDRVGEEFPGVITSVTGFGLFVELTDIYVEGLVHVTALNNDYYHFDQTRKMLRGERSGKTYSLGDKLKVRVARVDIDNRQIDFELAAEAQKVGGKKTTEKKVKDKKPDKKKKFKFKKKRRK